jgi:hypothetical protein
MSLKNPVTPLEIDPGTVRLVAQRHNNYATAGPLQYVYLKQILIFVTEKVGKILEPSITHCCVSTKLQ